MLHSTSEHGLYYCTCLYCRILDWGEPERPPHWLAQWPMPRGNLSMWHAGCDCPPNVPENTPIQSITHGQPGQRSHDNSGRQSIERPDLISCNNSSTVYVAYSGVHYLELPEVHFRYSRTEWTLISNAPYICGWASGQYLWHIACRELTRQSMVTAQQPYLPFLWVRTTIAADFCSHTIRQKSSAMSGSGSCVALPLW